MHPRYLTPTVSTLAMGGVSILLYAGFNYLSGGAVISDAVTAIGLYIAFYYGLTGFACAWYWCPSSRNAERPCRAAFSSCGVLVAGSACRQSCSITSS